MPKRTIKPIAPVDLRRSIGRLAEGRGDPSFDSDGAAMWMAARFADGPATIRFAPDSSGSGVISAEAWGPGADGALEMAPGICGALDDPSDFTPTHPLLKRLLKTFPTVRITRSGLVTESLLRTIVGQRVTGKEAHDGYRRMARALGEPAPGPRPLLLPPDPQVVAATGYPSFHPWGIERSRAEILIRVAGRARRMDEAADLPLSDAYARITAVRGVGPWTAGKIGSTVLGDPDAVPVGDYHLPNAVAFALAGEDRADDDRMLELLEEFRPNRGRVLGLLGAAGISAPKYGPRTAIRNWRDS